MAREDKIQRALEWARGMCGKHIPNSKNHECWDLPEEALKRHGLVTSKTLTPGGQDFRKANYVWGEQVKERDTRPEDIIQFRNHVVKKTVEIVMTFSDGSFQKETKREEQKRPHHTAIANGRSTPPTARSIRWNSMSGPIRQSYRARKSIRKM